MKKRNIIISIIVIILLIPISYVTFFHKFVDDKLYNEAKQEIDSFIENPWTGSIKEGVSEDDLINVENKMKYILSKSKKESLKKETNTILKQANLQTKLKSDSDKYYESTDPFSISEDTLNKLIKDSSKIKNSEVRVKILQQSYEVLDRLKANDDAIKSVNSLHDNIDKLKIENLKDYYTAKGLVENVYYENSKKSLEDKLNEVNKKLDNLMKDADKLEEAQLKKDLDNIKNTKYSYDKSSTQVTNISKDEFKDYKFFSENSDIKYIGYVTDSMLEVYERDVNGFRTLNKSVRLVNNLNKNTKDYLKREHSSFIKEETEIIHSESKTEQSSSDDNHTVDSTTDSSQSEPSSDITEVKYLNSLTFNTPEKLSITENKEAQNSLIVTEDDYNFIKNLTTGGLIIKI